MAGGSVTERREEGGYTGTSVGSSITGNVIMVVSLSVGVTTVKEVVRLMLLREDGDGTRSPPPNTARVACMGDEGKDISFEVPVDPGPSAGAIVKLLDSGAPPVPDANEFMLAMFLLPTGIGSRD